jgi:hypothetical protein
VAVWLALLLASHAEAARFRKGADRARELAARPRLQSILALKSASLVVALTSGLLLLQASPPGVGRARWLLLKLGLVVFLVLPLEAMHAFIAHVWIAGGLAQTTAPPFAKALERGLGVEEMIRTLEVPLFGVGLPLLLWLSFRRPF